ncbi:MAG: hypothetical protein AB8G77_01235 [Rhodothermales bacterium]
MAPVVPEKNVSTGEFPFPITDGPEESRYLTWIRNHSNYMAVRGLLDYVRAVSVLMRGVLVNLLIFLPYLLVLSVLVAIASFMDHPHPFLFTKILVSLFAFWILLFPVLTPFFRIVRFKKMRATGSDSSVRQRDKYERIFGGFLIAIVVVAAMESLPDMLDFFQSQISLPTLASTMAGVAVIFSIVPKLVSLLGEGLLKKVALFLVGALGLIVPLIVVLAVSGFIVYGPPADWTVWAVLAGIVFPILTIIAVLAGLLLGAFKKQDTRGVVLLIVASLALVVLIKIADQVVFSSYIELAEEVRNDAFNVLQEDEHAQELLASHVAINPGGYLADYFEITDNDLDPLPEPDSARSAKLLEIAETAQQAGLYPEFEAVEPFIAGKLEICHNPSSVEGMICPQFNNELFQLNASSQLLINALKAKTIDDLAAYLMSVPEGEIDELIYANDLYPVLLNRLDSESNSFEAGIEAAEDTTAITCETDIGTADSQITSADSAFFEVRSTFFNTGCWFKEMRQELAATASISLDETSFYESSEATLVRINTFWPKAVFISIFALLLWFFCWLTIDVNLTSIHGLYRDRLASAFLIGKDTEGDVDIEEDIDLMEICQHEAGSTAPYHLINTALNLGGSKDIGIRDRKSDFFVFSKRFIGGERTGYCTSEHMEEVFPQMDLATAMAISAAAASPNMGRSTSPALVAIMTLLNIRLGFWIPNPGALEDWFAKKNRPANNNSTAVPTQQKHITFEHVFQTELVEIQKRWAQLSTGSTRKLASNGAASPLLTPCPAHKLAGIAYSGGGIRSATVNLGMTQALERSGVFDHMDYMSTVSGGGYLGSSISTLMRKKQEIISEEATNTPANSVIDEITDIGKNTADLVQNSVGQIFQWRIRPAALVKEALGRVNETSRWVNVSDGGHIENLASIELLRRRCRFIITGDGEADPDHTFNGLATLIRTARIDLGIEININVAPLRLNESGFCEQHWAIGRIDYPHENEHGYLLYLKSSVTGDEDEVIRQYRSVNPSFPHESTADQFFTEGQFEAYRSLGQHIGEQVLKAGAISGADPHKLTFEELEHWFETLYQYSITPESEQEIAEQI